MMLADIYDHECGRCKLSQYTDRVCARGEYSGKPHKKIMVVGKMPNSERYQNALVDDLEAVGISIDDVFFASAVKCQTFDVAPSNADVKKCKLYLEDEIATVKPDFILALGNEALLATVGHSGITKYRGRVFDRAGISIIPTISPSAVMRNPGNRAGYMADLRLFSSKVKGNTEHTKIPKYMIVDTKEKLKELKRVLSHASEMSYDVETYSEDFDEVNRLLISVSGTCVVPTKKGDRLFCFALPLEHPESPWRKVTPKILEYLAPVLLAIPKIDAHNSKYDDKWMTQYGVPLQTTFDTILAIHVLDENVQKGLKPQAAARLGVEPWGIDTKDLRTTPLADVLLYNMLDTYYTYLVKRQLVEELKAEPRAARLFKNLMMPASNDLVFSEIRGIWLDVPLLEERRPIVEAKLKEIEDKLLSFVTDAWTDRVPTDAKGRPLTPNFNASNYARWYLFEMLALPVIERGKEKEDGRPGDPSMAEGVLMALKGEHPAVDLMLERVKWQKWNSSFIKPYGEIYDEDHRIHTNFKLTGTVTGRLSSGKSDADKVPMGRVKRRGVNLQQVPRDPFIRGLFGAPPGWRFVEADYSQIELRIAAYLAREETMLSLYQQGADIHLSTAARVTGLPPSQVTGEVRKKVGKPVNFGFLYGMGWRKFIQTAFENYGSTFTEAEARQAREAYFSLYPGLLPWHARQRSLVAKYGRVQSPLGRTRHLPDIYSPDPGVRAEAERQAINSPVQGMASDLAVLSMIEINKQLRALKLPAHCIGLVHDAINFEVREDAVADLLPIVKDTMEDMSIVRRKFGVEIDVPIVADLKIGTRWGGSHEIAPEDVYNYKEA